jgi:hypothetical protein
MTNIPLHSLFSFSVLPYPALSNRPASTALSTLRLHRRRRGERGGSRRLGLDLGRPHLDLGRLGWISAAPATQQPCRLAKGRGGGAADDCRWPSPPSRQGGRASAGYQVEGGGVDLLRIRDGEDGHRGVAGSGTRHRHLCLVLVTGGGSGGTADLARGHATSPGERHCLDAGRGICICLGTSQVREGGTEAR